MASWCNLPQIMALQTVSTACDATTRALHGRDKTAHDAVQRAVSAHSTLGGGSVSGLQRIGKFPGRIGITCSFAATEPHRLSRPCPLVRPSLLPGGKEKLLSQCGFPQRGRETASSGVLLVRRLLRGVAQEFRKDWDTHETAI